MKDLLKLIPRPIAVALVVLVIGAVALFLARQFLEMAYWPIETLHPESAEDVQAAERRLQLERLNVERESLHLHATTRVINRYTSVPLTNAVAESLVETNTLPMGTPGLPTGGTPGLPTGGTPGLPTGGTPDLPTGGTPDLPQANLEAHYQSLHFPATSPDPGMGALKSLAEIATNHLSTILAIMFAAYLLPSFANTGEPWRLALMISAGVTLSGTFALTLGATSPTVAALKVNIFSFSISSASVAVMLTSIGAVLTGVCIHMVHRHRAPAEQESSGHSATDG